jgi:AcrR family transcriptional regulator
VTSATESASPAESHHRPLRADAQRNRARILAAAEAVFARRGSGVGVDEVAAEAGVGVGTLYRHFPTKEALIEAILIDRLRRLTVDAQAHLDTPDPGKALFEFLHDLVEESMAKRDFIDAMAKGTNPPAPPGPEGLALVAKLNELAGELLARAQAAGVVRSDVTTPDLLGLALGPCMAGNNPFTSTCSPELMLAIVWDGLCPGRQPG